MIESPLPTDTNLEIRELETRFISKHKLTLYRENETVLSPKDTVFNCRSLDGNYVHRYGVSEPIDLIQDFKQFDVLGTTFTVNNDLTYLKYASWDLDCPCKSSSNFSYHLNENHATEFAEVVRKHFINNQLLGISFVECYIFSRDCGFHVYTNIPVSANYHCYLTYEILKARFGNTFIIEIPVLMPVPYSAKEPNHCYKPLYLSTPGNKINLTYCDIKFIDNFVYTKKTLDTDEGDIVHGVKKRIGSLIGSNKLFIYESRNIFWNGNEEITQIYSKGIRVTLSLDVLTKYTVYTRYVDILSTSLTNESHGTQSLIKLWEMFLLYFKTTFYPFSPQSGKQLFVNKSLIDNGAMNLIHYIIGAMKYLKSEGYGDIEQHLSEFVELLKTNVYNDFMVENSPDEESSLIKHVLTYVNFNCIEPYYGPDYQFIFEYLTENDVLDIFIDDSPVHVVQKLLNSRTGGQMFTNARQQQQGSTEEQTNQDNCIDVYLQILLKRKYLFKDLRNWFIYSLNGSYRVLDAGRKVPGSLLYGIGVFKLAKTIEKIETTLVNRQQEFLSPVSYCKCSFLISTHVGVFNSTCGLYIASSPILLFNSTHNRVNSLWYNPMKAMFVSNRINYALLETMESNKVFIESVLNENLMEYIWVHMLLIPAVLEIPMLPFISNKTLASFLKKLDQHRAQLNLLVNFLNYHPLCPKYVCMCIYILKECSTSENLVNYEGLVNDFLGSRYNAPSADWLNSKAHQEYTSISYNVVYSSYFTSLKSLKSESLHSGAVDESLLIIGYLLALCYTKNNNFRPFVQAFTSEASNLQLQTWSKTLPEDEDCYRTGRTYDSMQHNLKLTYTNMLSTYNLSKTSPMIERLFDIFVMVCMSTGFNKANLLEILNMDACVLFLVGNVKKKFFCKYGDSNCGKSLFNALLVEATRGTSVSLHNMKDAVEKGGIQNSHGVIVVTEVGSLNSSMIRSITGEDQNAHRQLFTDKFSSAAMQSIVVGATNSVISFDNQDFERTAVERVHAVRLCGRQQEDNGELNQLDYLSMLTENVFFMGIQKFKSLEDRTFSYLWLVWLNYLHSRNKQTLFPVINNNNQSVCEYREALMRHNSIPFRLLNNNGIANVPGYKIKTTVLFDTVKQFGAGYNLTKEKFLTDFGKHFSCSLKGETVDDFIQVGLLLHFSVTLATITVAGHSMTMESVLQRIRETYTETVDRENAIYYFRRKNEKSHWNRDTKLWENLQFEQTNVCNWFTKTYEHVYEDDMNSRLSNISQKVTQFNSFHGYLDSLVN